MLTKVIHSTVLQNYYKYFSKRLDMYYNCITFTLVMMKATIYTTETIVKRVKKDDSGCWYFIGPHDRDGYPRIKTNGKFVRVHRLSYTLFIGPIPDGLFVCHKCDNPGCINPDHLFVGTPKDNTHDMIRKGRHRGGRKKATVCKNGHLFSWKNSYFTKSGTKRCIICANERQRQFYHRNKNKINKS